LSKSVNFRERSIGGAEEGSQTIIPAPDDEKQTPDENDADGTTAN
jgi:hypothetical protein